MNSTENVETVVVGAGHAGLAVSRLLSDAGLDHVVLERGRVAERWRTERWDSLRLLTPSWMIRLPGQEYAGPAPDGYLSARRFVRLLDSYARSFVAPVVTGTHVRRLVEAAGPGGTRYRLETDQGSWRTANVVVATGPYARPFVPPGLGETVVVPSSAYRTPATMPPGGVLVVGASASGVQIADELARAGREVSLAVGRHTPLPRRYRGVDIYYWLEETGRLAQTIDKVPDPAAARREPSPQLVGRRELDRTEPDLDLGGLQARGVRLLGRLEGVEGTRARFRDDLPETVAAADAGMHRFLDAVDSHVARTRPRWVLTPTPRPGVVRPVRSPERLDLRAEGIGSVLLATGHQPDNPWLALPVTEPDGSIRQHRGATAAPGVYVVGQRFQHRRDSAFIDGARYGAADVVDRLLRSRGRTLETRQERAS